MKLRICLIIAILLLVITGCSSPLTVPIPAQSSNVSAPGAGLSDSKTLGCQCNIIIAAPNIEVYEDTALTIPLTSLNFGSISRNSTSLPQTINVANIGTEVVYLSITSNATVGEILIQPGLPDNAELQPGRYTPFQLALSVFADAAGGIQNFDITINAATE